MHIGFTILHMHTYTLCIMVTIYYSTYAYIHVMHCGYTLCTSSQLQALFIYLNLAPSDDPNNDAVLPLPLREYKAIIMAELQWETSEHQRLVYSDADLLTKNTSTINRKVF